MSDWWTDYLAGVQTERIPGLLREWGVPEAEIDRKARAVLSLAALCRLAFSRIATDRDVPMPGASVPSPAIISQTISRARTGRPPTARWAYWTVLIVREYAATDLELRLTSARLAVLIKVFTGRAICTDEVRGVLGRLKRQARDCARAAAEAFLRDPIRHDLSGRAFIKFVRGYLGDGLDPSSENPPMIVHGQLNEAWLQRLARVRRRILSAVRKKGPLAGEEPTLQLLPISEVLHGLPLTGSSAPVGIVHLDKGLDVPTPTSPDQGGKISVTISPWNKPPYGAALWALPQWWTAWQAANLLPVPDESISSGRGLKPS